MYKGEIAFYLGEQKENGYSGIITQDNFFFCLEISSGITSEEGHKIIEHVKEKIKTIKIENLNSLDVFIVDVIKANNFPTGFSIASGYLKNGLLYLKTVGDGKVFIRRKNKIGLLIEANNTASGQVEDNDFFIFSTDNFINLIGGISGLETTFDHRTPTQIIEEITPNLKAKNDSGSVALFINMHLLANIEEDSSQSEFYRQEINEDYQKEVFPAFLNNFSEKAKNTWFIMKHSKKTLTFLVVFFLFCIFLWSVILGYQRRTSAKITEKIKLTRELVSQKLTTAEDVAYLNIDRAIVLINESREEVNKLKSEAGKKNKQVDELDLMVKKAEDKILKKEQREYTEFYDLSVDDKNALGNKFYLDQDTAYILDKKRGVIYLLSLDKKSLNKYQFSEIKSADLIAGYDDKGYFFVKGSGIYQADDSEKVKKIVDKDDLWLDIKDMSIFNGNIYLLDKGKDEIWKHISQEDKFSSASSYFQPGQSIDFSSVNSLSIDGSIYLAGDSVVVKYTSGLRDGFSVDLPSKDNNFNKIFTTSDIDKIYLWDKAKGIIFVINKTGDYLEQINSEILTSGADFVVYNEKIFVLKGSKIYKID